MSLTFEFFAIFLFLVSSILVFRRLERRLPTSELKSLDQALQGDSQTSIALGYSYAVFARAASRSKERRFSTVRLSSFLSFSSLFFLIAIKPNVQGEAYIDLLSFYWIIPIMLFRDWVSLTKTVLIPRQFGADKSARTILLLLLFDFMLSLAITAIAAYILFLIYPYLYFYQPGDTFLQLLLSDRSWFSTSHSGMAIGPVLLTSFAPLVWSFCFLFGTIVFLGLKQFRSLEPLVRKLGSSSFSRIGFFASLTMAVCLWIEVVSYL